MQETFKNWPRAITPLLSGALWKSVENLVRTTTPRRLDGISWNFAQLIGMLPSCARNFQKLAKGNNSNARWRFMKSGKNLFRTTPPRWLGGISWNFAKFIGMMSSCARNFQKLAKGNNSTARWGFMKIFSGQLLLDGLVEFHETLKLIGMLPCCAWNFQKLETFKNWPWAITPPLGGALWKSCPDNSS